METLCPPGPVPVGSGGVDPCRRPTATRHERAARARATVVLAIDSSRSMEAVDVPPTRIEAARSAARSFLDDLPSKFQVGVVSFARRARILSRPTVDRVALGFALDSLETKPGTAIGDGIMSALDSRPEGRDVPLVVVLLSDGDNTTGTDPLEAAERAAGMNVKVFTIAFGGDAPGTGVPPPDDGTLRQVAEATGASFFDAPTAADLHDVYKDLGSSITIVPREEGGHDFLHRRRGDPAPARRRGVGPVVQPAPLRPPRGSKRAPSRLCYPQTSPPARREAWITDRALSHTHHELG